MLLLIKNHPQYIIIIEFIACGQLKAKRPMLTNSNNEDNVNKIILILAMTLTMPQLFKAAEKRTSPLERSYSEQTKYARTMKSDKKEGSSEESIEQILARHSASSSILDKKTYVEKRRTRPSEEEEENLKQRRLMKPTAKPHSQESFAGYSNASSSSSSSSLAQFDEKVFNETAQLYGNKTANLIELEKIVSHLNTIQHAKSFAVPTFFGLSSREIIAYLEKKPYEQTTVWNYILQLWKKFKAAQPQNALLLTDAARTILTDIRKVLNETNFDVMNITGQNPARKKQLKAFLNAAHEQNTLLMVRSTGREDGKELSNAGGNASIASVAPTVDAVSKAISEVLMSYVSEKSIGQRLVGKDKHLFDAPFMAVLLQIMMGEMYGESTEIPKSGVMFSPEAEGETPDVVVIQATFGHNEGVVNGLVPVDTYYTGPTNITHPVISIKPKRLSAIPGKDGLDFIPNEQIIQRVSTLDPETVLALKHAALFIQNYYNNAVDIEFVILGDTIYFVQARPLEAKKFEASYLHPDFITQNSTQAVSIIPIGVGNAAVRIITHPNQVIITDNIRQALNIFLYNTPDQNAVQAVIINESAPATSHEATQFRRLGKPVLYAEELNTLKTWLQQLSQAPTTSSSIPLSSSSYATSSSGSSRPEGSPIGTTPLLIDAQRALILPFTPNDLFISAESSVELGWYTHPIAKKVSLMPAFISKLPKESTHKLTPKEFFKGISITKLIDLIKTENPEEARNALRSLLHRVLATLQRTQLIQVALKETAANTNAKLINDLMRIFLAITESAHEISNTLTKPNASRLERLYPITFLEALIRQLPEPNRLVNDYSFGSVLKTELQEQTIVNELNLQGAALREYVAQYAKAASSVFTPATRSHFQNFLRNLNTIEDPITQQKFARLIYDLQTLNLIPFWLNSSFQNAYAESPDDIQKTTLKLLEEYEHDADYFSNARTLMKDLSAFNPSAFEDPALFLKQYDALQKVLLNTVNHANALNTATGLKLLITLQIIKKTIDILDTSIKALTGSTLYTKAPTDKIKHFKSLLLLYFNLFETLTKISRINSLLSPLIDTETFSSLDEYVKKIEGELVSLINANNSLEQLESSPDFNVASAMLASAALWERSIPAQFTLEDLFTLIHQNLLIIVSRLTPAFNQQNLPATFNTLTDTISKLTSYNPDSDTSNKTNLVGVSFENNMLRYYYNLPMRNHSSTLQVAYDPNSDKTTLTLQYLGFNEYNRWGIIKDMAFLFTTLIGANLETPGEFNENLNSLKLTWEIKNKEQVDLINQFIEGSLKFSFFDFTTEKWIKEICQTLKISTEQLKHAACEILNDQPTEYPALLTIFEDSSTLSEKEKTCLNPVFKKMTTSFATLPLLKQKILWYKMILLLRNAESDFIRNHAVKFFQANYYNNSFPTYITGDEKQQFLFELFSIIENITQAELKKNRTDFILTVLKSPRIPKDSEHALEALLSHIENKPNSLREQNIKSLLDQLTDPNNNFPNLTPNDRNALTNLINESIENDNTSSTSTSSSTRLKDINIDDWFAL